MGILELISVILNLVLGTGFIVSMVTLRSEKRKKSAEAGMTEMDLKKAELETAKMLAANALEIDKLQDATYKERLESILNQLAHVTRLLNQTVEAKTNLELEIVDLTKRVMIAEKRLENSRCDELLCKFRKPPFANEELGSHNLIDPKELQASGYS